MRTLWACTCHRTCASSRSFISRRSPVYAARTAKGSPSRLRATIHRSARLFNPFVALGQPLLPRSFLLLRSTITIWKSFADSGGNRNVAPSATAHRCEFIKFPGGIRRVQIKAHAPITFLAPLIHPMYDFIGSRFVASNSLLITVFFVDTPRGFRCPVDNKPRGSKNLGGKAEGRR